MKNKIYYLSLFGIFMLFIASCGKNSYNKFEGEYDVKSSGDISYTIGDTTLKDEPGLVFIKKGEKSNELFMYVETNFVTSIAPLGVYANATIDGKNFELDPRSLDITIDFGGTPLSLPFVVSGTGTLSKDNKTLTSDIVFSGGISGTISNIGTKKEK